MNELIELIEKFIPYNEQESNDKELILKHLHESEGILTRENKTCHLTSSAWVLNESCDKVLMAYHNIYDSWAWLGGHADGESNLLAVAKREAIEESGIKEVSTKDNSIFSLEALTVDGHMKNGKYVSSHLHLNVTFLLFADENDIITHKVGENSSVEWIKLSDINSKVSEAWFKEWIYSKLIEKVNNVL